MNDPPGFEFFARNGTSGAIARAGRKLFQPPRGRLSWI